MKKIKYEIYCCTNIETQKVYIGYTKLGIFKRWKKHLLNANSGLDTYFYKSIRKYGPEKWTIKKLWETFDKKEILKKEKEFIQKYECLIPLGYNSTEGGTGGDIWYGDNLSNRRKNLSKACSGINNPRYSGISDDEIITEAVALYKKYNQWIPKFWIEIVEIKKFPKFFTKFRFSEFGGGNTGFKLAVLAALKNEGFENASLKEVILWLCLNFLNCFNGSPPIL